MITRPHGSIESCSLRIATNQINRFKLMSSYTRAGRRDQQDQQRANKTIRSMSVSATTVWMARHGETAWNLEHRLQGQCEADPPLNATGEQQAQALAERLSSTSVAAIYSSDFQRTMQTAQFVAAKLNNMQVEPVKELRERHLGVLEGLTRTQAALQFPADFSALGTPDAKPQGGESQSDVAQRVVRKVEQIALRHPGQSILLVLHGGVLHACYRHAVGHEYTSRNLNCAINVLKIDGSKWAMLDWNDAAHLKQTGVMTSAFGGGAEGG